MKKEKLNNNIFFSGGGTLGSVTPLLGLSRDIKNRYPEFNFIWIGTEFGPEKDLIEENNIEFISIKSGKFRRYLDINNFIDIFKIIIAFFQSIKLLLKYKPKIVLTAGGFVSVPLVIASKILGIPAFIHQQDFEVGLANKIMKIFAEKVTVCLDKSVADYGNSKKVIKIGNFVRKTLFDYNREAAINFFNIKSDKPVLLVTGGGTGSMFINDLIINNIDEILKYYEVIHLAGINKNGNVIENKYGYRVFEFLLKEMKMALNIADVVITRAGFGILTELSALKKATIIIPLPGHQDLNAKIFENDSFVFYQKDLNKDIFLNKLKELSENNELRKRMGEKMGNVIGIGNDKMVDMLEKYLK